MIKVFAYGAGTRYGWPFKTIPLTRFIHVAVLQPRRPGGLRFGLFRFRSPLLAESLLISFPRGTEMFHFPRLSSRRLCIQRQIREVALAWVAPFGNPRINACLRLPEAYRSLLRPSSTPDAKASTLCP